MKTGLYYSFCVDDSRTTTTSRIDANPEMVALCFRALVNHLNGNSETLSNSLPNLTVGGLFVTWQSKHGELRGCLGTLSEVPLSRLLEYAITSSQNDDRFSPLSLHESTIFPALFRSFIVSRCARILLTGKSAFTE